MVQRYVVHNTEMNRINDGDLRDNKEWSLVVSYEDYAKLKADRDYWYEKCLDAGLLDGERAADRKEQDELLDEWYRTEECPYASR